MADTQYTWHIANLERETAEDGTYSSGAYGSLGFERPDKLIPFADLTEELVIGWVQDAFGAEKVTEILAALQAQLDEQHHPSKASGTPWQ
jgi:hypothetical protein